MGITATPSHASALSDALSMTPRNGNRERTVRRRVGLSVGERGLAPFAESSDAFAEIQGRRAAGEAADLHLQQIGQRAVRGTREEALRFARGTERPT